MKYRIFLLSILMIMVGSAVRADRSSEFRAVWVHNWLPGLLSPAEVDSTIKWAKDSNMNVIIAQVRRVGDAYYASSCEPRGSNICPDPSFDPLAYTIAQARANGLEIHAWFNVFRVATPTTPLLPGHPALTHPEWLSKDVNGKTVSPDGMFLDPGVPAVREYLVSLISEILTKYEIDGINLDFIRYPGKQWGYNDIAIAAFNAEYGRSGKPLPDDLAWCDWRRRQVTGTVRAIRVEMSRLKPLVKLSADTVAWGKCPSDFKKTDAYAHVFQDWRLWMEEGLIDANMPMNYKNPSIAKNQREFAGWLDGFKRWSYGRHTYCGLMVFKNSVSGAAKQVSLARVKGMDGIAGFAFSQINSRAALATKLNSTVYASPADVPVMAWKDQIVIGGSIK
ncbi:MAG: glycoside hydrolase family 10 protein [Armatimonadota bacterium]